MLLKPDTFMNQSGRAVTACAEFFHLPTNRTLVVHDDLDLPVGRIKVVRNGGPGGHKGAGAPPPERPRSPAQTAAPAQVPQCARFRIAFRVPRYEVQARVQAFIGHGVEDDLHGVEPGLLLVIQAANSAVNRTGRYPC